MLFCFRIIRFVESGISEWLYETTKSSHGYGGTTFEKVEEVNKFEVLGLTHVKSCFYLLSLGVGVSIIAFACEIYRGKWQQRKQNQVEPSREQNVTRRNLCSIEVDPNSESISVIAQTSVPRGEVRKFVSV